MTWQFLPPINVWHNLFYGHEISSQKLLFIYFLFLSIFEYLFLEIYKEDKLY